MKHSGARSAPGSFGSLDCKSSEIKTKDSGARCAPDFLVFWTGEVAVSPLEAVFGLPQGG